MKSRSIALGRAVIAISATGLLGACAHPQLGVGAEQVVEKSSGPTCGESGLSKLQHPGEDFRCFLQMTGPESEHYQTAEQRRDFVTNHSFSTACVRNEVVSDEPASPSTYIYPTQARLRRVGVKCVQ